MELRRRQRTKFLYTVTFDRNFRFFPPTKPSIRCLQLLSRAIIKMKNCYFYDLILETKHMKLENSSFINFVQTL